jgi:hypothetical protein
MVDLPVVGGASEVQLPPIQLAQAGQTEVVDRIRTIHGHEESIRAFQKDDRKIPPQRSFFKYSLSLSRLGHLSKTVIFELRYLGIPIRK